MKQFKISCSSIGKIMTNGRGKSKAEKIAELSAKLGEARQKYDTLKDALKSKQTMGEKIAAMIGELDTLNLAPDLPELSETAKSYCEQWAKEQLYERRKQFTSKETEKGNKTEIEAMDYAAQHLGWGWTVKNTERRANEWMEGECDLVVGDWIHDTKCAWDCFTFPLFEQAIPETDYEWQIQGYMSLWQKPFGSVVYALMDMPQDYIDKEVRFRLGNEYSLEQYEAFVSQYRYGHLPPHRRLKQYKCEYGPAKIEQINARVEQCRVYINHLLTTI